MFYGVIDGLEAPEGFYLFSMVDTRSLFKYWLADSLKVSFTVAILLFKLRRVGYSSKLPVFESILPLGLIWLKF